MMKYSILAIVLALLIGLLANASVHAQSAIADLEGDLICQCGTCTKVVGDCECGTASEMKETIGRMVDEGQTEQQILDYFIDQYGEKVLAASTNGNSASATESSVFTNESSSSTNGNSTEVLYGVPMEMLICQCGTCTKVVRDCECDTAGEMMNTVEGMVEEGKTEQQILDYFVAQYGEKVLVAPEAKVVAASTGGGLNPVVWAVPFVAIAGGGGVLYFILQGRSGRGKVARRKRR